jgi:hypothetical protein
MNLLLVGTKQLYCRHFLKSWGVLIIGFQARASRPPNIYNSKIWDYYTKSQISLIKNYFDRVV